jgi:hypothetical protein
VVITADEPDSVCAICTAACGVAAVAVTLTDWPVSAVTTAVSSAAPTVTFASPPDAATTTSAAATVIDVSLPLVEIALSSTTTVAAVSPELTTWLTAPSCTMNAEA